MKRNTIRLIALLLSVLLLLPLAACDTDPEPQETPETTATPPSEESTTAAETDDPSVVKVNWNFGYIGSVKDPNAFAYMINPEGVGYSYTDIITIEKAGTKVYFLDPTAGETEDTVLTVSSWVRIGNKWMPTEKGVNLEGKSPLIMTATDDGTLYSYVSTNDNESIRFCYRSGQTGASDAISFPVIRTEPTSDPGTSTLIITDEDRLTQWIENDKSRAFYDLLDGLTFTVIGDSYFGGSSTGKDKVWPNLLARKYGMTFHNYGIGGSTISNYVTTNHPMVDRYGQMIQNNPDLIIVEGGRNDYNLSVPLGTLGDTETTTMYGATHYLLTKIRQKYPNAVIIGLTCWETGGIRNGASFYCSEYGTAMLEVCAELGIPCINAMDQEATGVYMTDHDFRTTYCQTPTDVSHLNLEGMKLVLPFFEAEIYRIYSEELAKRGS